MNYYKDQPTQIEDWINTLSEEELLIFDAGYVCALQGLLEQIIDSKRKILLKMMQNDENEDIRTRLEERIRILDIYENHYEQRAQNLSKKIAKV